jgi:hypothetical protein
VEALETDDLVIGAGAAAAGNLAKLLRRAS